MHQLIKEHYDRAIAEYTSGEFYDTMIEAKKEYFELTGVLHEDEEDYETKMNAFNDWYMLRYVSKDGGPFMKIYIEKNELGEEFYNAFIRCNYSLFEYLDKSFRGAHVFRDILHSTKFSLAKGHRELPCSSTTSSSDGFLEYQKEYYFLDGMTLFPKRSNPFSQRSQTAQEDDRSQPRVRISYQGREDEDDVLALWPCGALPFFQVLEAAPFLFEVVGFAHGVAAFVANPRSLWGVATVGAVGAAATALFSEICYVLPYP